METNKKTLRLYWNQVQKHKRSFFIAMALIPLAEVCFTLLIPLSFSRAVGGLTTLENDIVLTSMVVAALAAAVGVLCNLVGFQALTRQAGDVGFELRNDTFSRIINKDMAFFVNQKVGALTSKYIDFVRAEDTLQNLLIIRTLGFSITLITGICIIGTQSALLAGIIAILFVILVFQVRWSMQKREQYRREKHAIRAELHGTVADAITNNLIVKTFAREKSEIRSVKSLSSRYRTLLVKDIGFLSYEGSVRNLVMYTAQVTIISICAYMVLDGRLALATLVFLMAYLQRVSSQLFVLSEIINGYDQTLLEAAPMTDILSQPVRVMDAPHATNLVIKQPVVALEDVSYQYESDGEHVLRHVNLRIENGEKIGLVGHSGAGKTTLVHLLLRFNDVTGGRITIDGRDIRDITQESLRESISFVPQEPMLFHRTLRENIRYGRLHATDEDIDNAVQQANAAEFVSGLPKGLDTLVGERGVKLSGGQKQRIAIARAIVKDAPILLLDEATSALDSASELLIQDALFKLMERKTSIVIAHRLSTIQKMDRIVVVEKGLITEQGTHKELLALGGTYARLWAHQSGGFIDE